MRNMRMLMNVAESVSFIEYHKSKAIKPLKAFEDFTIGWELEILSPSISPERIKEIVSGVTGIPFLNEWRGRTSTCFQLHRDDSIHPKGAVGEWTPMEIVSPPITPAHRSGDALLQTIAVLAMYGVTWNASTGLHISFSVPEMAQRINVPSLVRLFAGEAEMVMLKRWNRLGSKYCRPLWTAIMDYIKPIASMDGVTPDERAELFRQALEHSGKRSTLNVSKYLRQLSDPAPLHSPYLELRVVGGADIPVRVSAIIKTMIELMMIIRSSSERPFSAGEMDQWFVEISKSKPFLGCDRNPYQRVPPRLEYPPILGDPIQVPAGFVPPRL